MAGKAVMWRERIERQKLSGLPIRSFCEREGVSAASFFAWRKRLACEPAPMFLPVRVVEPVRNEPAIELQCVVGTVLRIFDGTRRQTLIDVLAALAGDST